MAPAQCGEMRAARALTEFVGTMFLCLTVALAAGSSTIAPIAIGGVLMVAVYSGGHVSGGHYNPAVTLAALVRGGKISPADAALHVVSQVSGAFVAALLAWALVGKSAAAHAVVTPGVSKLAACLCEFVVTFALCSVVLHTATVKATAGNSFFGLAIGFTVLSGAVAVGGISGGAFNPAVGSMTLLYGDASSDVWVYWLAPLLGGMAAGAAFRALAWQEYQETVGEWRNLASRCAIEAIGTGMLCFTVGTAAATESSLAPLAIGSMLMVMIFMGGWHSGGHYNPAVTLAVLTRSLLGAKQGRFSPREALGYIIFQLFGSLVGAWAAAGALESRELAAFPSVPATSGPGKAFLGEVLGTFLLASTVLNSAAVQRVEGNSYFGLAIGFSVTAMACAIGPVSGGAFNPAVGTMGPLLGREADGAWVYWVACLLGGALAGASFRVQNFQEYSEEPAALDAEAAQAQAKKPASAATMDSINAVHIEV